ncbi:MAG: CheR family methyltransferase, partial [Pseudomonadota bacterium]
HHRSKFRDVDDETVEVCESIKQLITVRKLNLIQAWPFKGRFATIFCRNVVIYFGADLTNQMWSQFTKYLEPEGRLYIGHSERVKGPALDHLSPVGITTYQRIGS